MVGCGREMPSTETCGESCAWALLGAPWRSQGQQDSQGGEFQKKAVLKSGARDGPRVRENGLSRGKRQQVLGTKMARVGEHWRDVTSPDDEMGKTKADCEI